MSSISRNSQPRHRSQPGRKCGRRRAGDTPRVGSPAGRPVDFSPAMSTKPLRPTRARLRVRRARAPRRIALPDTALELTFASLVLQVGAFTGGRCRPTRVIITRAPRALCFSRRRHGTAATAWRSSSRLFAIESCRVPRAEIVRCGSISRGYGRAVPISRASQRLASASGLPLLQPENQSRLITRPPRSRRTRTASKYGVSVIGDELTLAFCIRGRPTLPSCGGADPIGISPSWVLRTESLSGYRLAAFGAASRDRMEKLRRSSAARACYSQAVLRAGSRSPRLAGWGRAAHSIRETSWKSSK